MERTFHFQVATADGAIVDVQASYAGVPLTDGEYGILAGHASMLAALKEGVIKFVSGGEADYAAISGGVLSIADDEVIVLARSAELADSIDLARAQASERRARERLEDKSFAWDVARVELSLQRAMAREKAYSLSHDNK